MFPCIDYLHFVVFIIFVMYLILTACFLFQLANWLLETIVSFLKKFRNRLLGLSHAVFPGKKIRKRLFSVRCVVVFS